MGGDLSLGRVDGDMVRCPYHEWGWGAEGMCLDIPYAKRIPKEARIMSWLVCEENKLLFIWERLYNIFETKNFLYCLFKKIKTSTASI